MCGFYFRHIGCRRGSRHRLAAASVGREIDCNICTNKMCHQNSRRLTENIYLYIYMCHAKQMNYVFGTDTCHAWFDAVDIGPNNVDALECFSTPLPRILVSTFLFATPSSTNPFPLFHLFIVLVAAICGSSNKITHAQAHCIALAILDA